MRSHACHHAAVVHHAAFHHPAAVHMAMHHFGGFGATTPHVYHHSHHTSGTRSNHSYYQPEPVVQHVLTLDEVKSHIKKHLTVSHYQSATDFERLVEFFLSSTEMSMKEKIQYLQDCIKGLDGPYFWDKYSDIVAQLPRHTADIDELMDLVIPFHFVLQTPTYENAARDIVNHDRNFVASIDKHFLSSSIVLTDFCRILNAHDEKKSMADILDYSTAFFSYLDKALALKEFKDDAVVVRILKNMESHGRQVFGRHPAAHSIMEKLLEKGVDANELFALLTPSNGFDHDLRKYAQLLVVFSQHGIDKAVIKTKLQAELNAMANTGHHHFDGTPKTDHRFKTLGDNFGPVFCLLAKNGLLPHLEYDHEMRLAIYKEIKKLPAAEQAPILKSILNHDDNDVSNLYWRAPRSEFLFGKKLILPGYWQRKFEEALAKLSIAESTAPIEEKAETKATM